MEKFSYLPRLLLRFGERNSLARQRNLAADLKPNNSEFRLQLNCKVENTVANIFAHTGKYVQGIKKYETISELVTAPIGYEFILWKGTDVATLEEFCSKRCRFRSGGTREGRTRVL